MKKAILYMTLLLLWCNVNLASGQNLFDKNYLSTLLDDTATVVVGKLDRVFIVAFNKKNRGEKKISKSGKNRMQYGGRKGWDPITLILKNDNKYLILVSRDTDPRKRWKFAPKYLICAELVSEQIDNQAKFYIREKYVNNKVALWYYFENN